MKAKKVENVPVLIRVPKPLLRKIDAAAKAQARSRSFVLVDAAKRTLSGGAA